MLALRWTEPDNNDDMYFYIDPVYHDGTSCEDYEYMEYGEIGMFDLFKPICYFHLPGCGAIGGPDSATDHSAGVIEAELTFTLTQLDDGTKYQDYTYQVVVEINDEDYSPSISKGELVISYEGEVKHIVKIPQYHGADYVNNHGRSYYFFGCFRPYVEGYYLDTNGAGFYDGNRPGPFEGDDVIEGFKVFDNGLCNALREWTGPLGYNHNYDQSGSYESTG